MIDHHLLNYTDVTVASTYKCRSEPEFLYQFSVISCNTFINRSMTEMKLRGRLSIDVRAITHLMFKKRNNFFVKNIRSLLLLTLIMLHTVTPVGSLFFTKL